MPRLLTKVLRANEFWVFLVIFALTLVIQARSGQFYTPNNLVDLAGAMVSPGSSPSPHTSSWSPAGSTCPSRRWPPSRST